MNIKDQVFNCIKKEKTIPQICKELGIDDEFVVMHAIADLKYENRVVLSGFDRFYEPSGYAGYLAKYEVTV